MNFNDSVKDQPINDGDSSTHSEKPLIIDAKDQQRNNSTKKPKESKKKIRTPTPQSPADKPSFRGPFGITIASTILWYVCIGILFVIAFISLVLSTLYFVTSQTDLKVVKLYGIAGSGTLAVITFMIVFLDCCNNTGQKDHEQEALYLAYQEKEAKEKELALRRNRRIAEGKEKMPKPFIIQHQRPVEEINEPRSPTPEYLPPHFHHVHSPPINNYHHPFVCPICHDLHASGNARHNLTDIAVDTSDKLLVSTKKSNRIVVKSTRDVQTDPQFYDAEQGTQTDRNEGTQTTAMELAGMPGNVKQIIHETTILKAPRGLLATLKKSMAEQDREKVVQRSTKDSNTTTD